MLYSQQSLYGKILHNIRHFRVPAVFDVLGKLKISTRHRLQTTTFKIARSRYIRFNNIYK
jgi:hypothetical protein